MRPSDTFECNLSFGSPVEAEAQQNRPILNPSCKNTLSRPHLAQHYLLSLSLSPSHLVDPLRRRPLRQRLGARQQAPPASALLPAAGSEHLRLDLQLPAAANGNPR